MKTGCRRKICWRREERLPTLDELAWLESVEGQAACAAMAAGRPADTPAAIARWRQHLEAKYVTAAWGQVLLRRAAAAKFSRAADMLFDRVALEQATDEIVAAYKARRFDGFERVADLCCGIGGDAIALAAGRELLAIDWSPPRLAMARHNVEIYGRRILVSKMDVAVARPDAEAIHIDPDRRRDGKRAHDPACGSPDLGELRRIIEHYQHAAIKLSPGADVSELPFDAEVELISHHGQCKQAVAWTGGLRQVRRRATVLPRGESITACAGDDISWPAVVPPRPGAMLFEPDPAVIRADLVGVLARRHGLSPLDAQIAYLTGEKVAETTLLRAFRIVDAKPWSLHEARPWLADHDVGQLEVKTRGFAARPEEILRRLRLSGRRRAVLLLTRSGNKPLAILAERITTEGN